MKDKKIAIIGCGNLGLSILNGLLSEGIPASNITATRRNVASLDHLKDSGIKLSSDNKKAISDSEIIVVALKPYTILEVLAKLQDQFDPQKHVIVSLATGISLNQIQEVVKNSTPIFRAMPNTGADVGMSMTCICGNSDNSVTADLVKQCFNSIGETIIIDESLMDSATVLGACGIAYVLRFIRAMIQGGVQIGFDAKTATNIVTHTVQGAAELLIKNGEHPEFEIDKVTTPKGCTIAGLNEMEHNGMSSALIKGIVTSYDIIEK
ncbi:MAG: pyrroline-5-carboxylate reductase [Crocinitomicaceae bacterium]|nr:pyrroline-5-carboxylate reductase [Crocinitomicaceae bacterium]